MNQQITKKESDYDKLKNLENSLQVIILNLLENLNNFNTEKNDLFDRNQIIEQSHDNLKKDYSILNENYNQLGMKKLDLEFEKIQLITKLEENRSELIREKARNDSLILENEELLNKVTHLGKLRIIIDELNQQIIKKESEYITLKNSNESLKTDFENFKNEKIKFIEDLKGFYYQFIEHHSQNIEHLVDKKIVLNKLINYLFFFKGNNELKKKKALEELFISPDLNADERKKIGLDNSKSNLNPKKASTLYSSSKLILFKNTDE